MGAAMIDGLFIVLEGVDGAGTTTHTKLLAASLGARGLPVHTTREPSDGPIGVMIRQILTGRLVVPGMNGPRPPTWKTMALLFAADRADHVEAEIEPNLRDGVTVISDRYYHSSVAYQSATAPEGADRAGDVARWVREINRHARRPDLTLVLDVPPDVAAKRRAERGRGQEIYDDLELQRVLSGFYRDLDAFFPDERIVHIDSNAPRDEVAAQILAAVRRARGEP
ncbi:MAG: dTMP kinase [Deltaproteobacteria bacterium]